MFPFAKLPPFVPNPETWNVGIETPKGSRNKFAWERSGSCSSSLASSQRVLIAVASDLPHAGHLEKLRISTKNWSTRSSTSSSRTTQ